MASDLENEAQALVKATSHIISREEALAVFREALRAVAERAWDEGYWHTGVQWNQLEVQKNPYAKQNQGGSGG